jgi:Holliday junction resolvase-like predicted endonuclease
VPRIFSVTLQKTKCTMGQTGENITAAAYAAKGWQIIGRRVRKRGLEIDLIAIHPQNKIGKIIEVKTRSVRNESFHRWGCVMGLISKSKSVALQRGAQHALDHFLIPRGITSVSLDIVLVLLQSSAPSILRWSDVGQGTAEGNRM